MKPLYPGQEVMLHGPAAESARTFNPYYGLVVEDHGWNITIEDETHWEVSVLWEDGQERVHRRKDLIDWQSIGLRENIP